MVRRDEPKIDRQSSAVSKTERQESERERPDSFSFFTPGRTGALVGVVLFIGLLFGSRHLLENLHEEVTGVSGMPTPSITPNEAARSTALITAEMFRVTSIALGEGPLAVVNGKSLGVGDWLELKTSGGVATLRVVTIADGVVYLENDGKMIAARLLVKRRPESSPR